MTGDAAIQAYHDAEWVVPHHGDRVLSERPSLEGAQADLSWRPARRLPCFYARFHGRHVTKLFGQEETEQSWPQLIHVILIIASTLACTCQGTFNIHWSDRSYAARRGQSDYAGQMALRLKSRLSSFVF